MQAFIPDADKWKASRLAMHSACDGGNFEDVQDVLVFLDYHFELAMDPDQSQDEPIQDALSALAYTSEAVTTKALEQFDPTKPSFVHGISRALHNDRPPKLREAALLFLPLIGESWFNARSPIMDSTQMSNFFMNWASVVDSVEKTPAVQKATLTVLLGMASSPPWRPHIIPDKWSLLECFTPIPDVLQSLRGYVNNPGLTDEIMNVDNPKAVVLWVEILWSEYVELTPGAREQLETVTGDIARNERGADIGTSQSYVGKYLSNMTSELKKAEDAFKQYMGGYTGAAALREEIATLKEALKTLNAISVGRAP